MKSETTPPPTMGVFKSDRPLQLVPFPNGGWTVVQSDSAMCHPTDVGAYSSTQDMLDALTGALVQN